MTNVANSPADQASDGLTDFEDAVDAMLSTDALAPDDSAANDNQEGQSSANDNQPGSQMQPGNDPAAAPAPAATQATDIWANAPQELREAYQRERADFEHRLKSTTGRLSAADRELARLRAESNQRAAPATESQSQGNGPSDEELLRVQEEYGDIVSPILKQIQGLKEQLGQVSAPIEQINQERALAAQGNEIQILTHAHPDWQSYTNDPRYPEWVSQQPKAVQEAAARAVSLEDGHEAAWLLGQFKQSMGVQQQSPTANNTPAPKPSADQRRQRQLNAGRDAGGGSPPVQTGVPDDFDAATEAFINKANREANRRGNGQFA
jgi:ppGpp synthetase/RelA/SpoT-type nucleotidyltranferase